MAYRASGAVEVAVQGCSLIESFEIVGPGGVAPVVGRSGGATSFARTADAGLHIIGYRSRRMPHELVARSFESYLREEGLSHIAGRRVALGEVRHRVGPCRTGWDRAGCCFFSVA